MSELYRKKVAEVEAVQFDGENVDEITEFVGGKDFVDDRGDELVIIPSGRNTPQGYKLTVTRGQWVAKPATGVVVINEGEFSAQYETKSGEPIPALPPEEEPEPVPEEQLQYQPGYGPGAGSGPVEQKPGTGQAPEPSEYQQQA